MIIKQLDKYHQMNKSQKTILNIYHFGHFEYSDSHKIPFTS